MNIFIDMDGTLSEFRYKNKINITTKEWNNDYLICKDRNVTKITKFLNKKYKLLNKHEVYILTNLPKSNIFVEHSIAKKNWCEKHLKFRYNIIINKEGKSKWKAVKHLTENNSHNILIDDLCLNLFDWENNGGIALHISTLLTKEGKNEFIKMLKR